MKRVFVIVIDGLGFGGNDNARSTIGSILSADLRPAIGKTMTSLEALCRNTSHNPAPFAATITPLSTGADSYKGHFEMIGITVQPTKVFTHKVRSALTSLYPDKQWSEMAEGVYRIGRSTYISNNIEADLGGAINLIVDLNDTPWDQAIEEGKKISQEVRCQRVIVMANRSIDDDNIKNAIKSRYDAELQENIYGIIPAQAKIYGDGYRSYHVGRSLSSYQEKNYLRQALDAHMRLALVGKSSDLFQDDSDGISNYVSSEIAQTYAGILAAKKSGCQWIFANFQTVDLMCHARDPKKAKKALEDVCNYLDKLIVARRSDEMIIITADHGNNPIADGNAHTKEKVPFLVFSDTPPNIQENELRGLKIVSKTAYEFLN